MQRINKIFYNTKEMPLDEFISSLMYNKKFGYYFNSEPFGKKGDFITSPGISYLFSEMLALWIVAFWEHLERPKKFNVVELGPGNGELSQILIKTFKRFPAFFKSSNIYLYEKSLKLINVQKKNLKNEKVNWIKNINQIQNKPTIFFGNEFFDAIPIKQYKKINGVLYEKFISIGKRQKINYSFKKAPKKIVNVLENLNLLKNQSFIEYPKKGFEELNKITKFIRKSYGGLLLIDYGFLNQKNLDTLQSVKKHKKNELFNDMSKSDISSLVNFTLLKNYLKKEKLAVNKVVNQEFFLKKMGILQRAEIISKKMSFKDKADLFFRLKRLLDINYMGRLFKVIFAFKLKKKFLLGFN